ncbi:hypothetical protein ScPMuIL_018170 [Solemya velum]
MEVDRITYLSGAGEDTQLQNYFEFLHPSTRTLSYRDEVLPIGRSGHCVAADESNIYVFGGYNPKGRDCHDQSGPPCVLIELWIYNLSTGAWRKMKTDGIPDTCASSCLAVVDKRLFVYGGTGYPFGRMMSNTLKILDCRASLDDKGLERNRHLCWHLLETNPNEYTALDCGDSSPPRAYGQSLIFQEDAIYVYGGAVGFYDEAVADLHRLNFNTMSWEKLVPSGSPPLGTYKQEIAKDSERFYIFGGGRLHYACNLEMIYAYNFKQNAWIKLKSVPDPANGFPQPRCSFGLVQTGNDVYICGGRFYSTTTSHQSLSDIWHCNLLTLQWRRLDTCLPEPFYFHSVCASPSGYMYLYGGVRANGIRSADIYRWKLPLFLTSLTELCWEALVKNSKGLGSMNRNALLSLGIPANFVKRLKHL